MSEVWLRASKDTHVHNVCELQSALIKCREHAVPPHIMHACTAEALAASRCNIQLKESTSYTDL